jgi:hypothetical protein
VQVTGPIAECGGRVLDHLSVICPRTAGVDEVDGVGAFLEGEPVGQTYDTLVRATLASA